MVHTYNPSAYEVGLGDQGYYWLLHEFDLSLGYMRPYLKKKASKSLNEGTMYG